MLRSFQQIIPQHLEELYTQLHQEVGLPLLLLCVSTHLAGALRLAHKRVSLMESSSNEGN
jgi:hypothetical protein